VDERSLLTRRALLGAASVGLVVSGCSAPTAKPRTPQKPEPPDHETILLAAVIADKEQMISLYRQTAMSNAGLAAALAPFEQRHAAHLVALRKLVPAGATAASQTPSAIVSKASPAGLRDAERRAAAARPGQLAGVSPALAQLLASIGACEAVHVLALGELRE
jgi:hypothetical protein